MTTEQGMAELYRPSSEIEAREIEALLSEAGIASALIPAKGMAFPSVSHGIAQRQLDLPTGDH